jgi:phage tail sheath gpL-like
LFWAVVDGSKAGNVSQPQRALLVGQMLTSGASAGTALPDVPVPVGSVALARQMFGPQSMLARMVEVFMNSNTTQQLWAGPVAEPTAGVAATGTITFVAQATGSGVYTVYIAGQKVQINAIVTMPVSASAAAGVVTLTCYWKGLTGNDINIKENFRGIYGGEVSPVGLLTTIAPMASGAGSPSFVNLISAVQSLDYDYLAMPFTDAASMASWNTEYGFGATGRWNFTRQQYAGHVDDGGRGR